MVNFPTSIAPAARNVPAKPGISRRVVPSTAADKRETRSLERRTTRDRRRRRTGQQIMDRRSGPERRRSTIDFSV